MCKGVINSVVQLFCIRLRKHPFWSFISGIAIVATPIARALRPHSDCEQHKRKRRVHAGVVASIARHHCIGAATCKRRHFFVRTYILVSPTPLRRYRGPETVSLIRLDRQNAQPVAAQHATQSSLLPIPAVPVAVQRVRVPDPALAFALSASRHAHLALRVRAALRTVGCAPGLYSLWNRLPLHRRIVSAPRCHRRPSGNPVESLGLRRAVTLSPVRATRPRAGTVASQPSRCGRALQFQSHVPLPRCFPRRPVLHGAPRFRHALHYPVESSHHRVYVVCATRYRFFKTVSCSGR